MNHSGERCHLWLRSLLSLQLSPTFVADFASGFIRRRETSTGGAGRSRAGRCRHRPGTIDSGCSTTLHDCLSIRANGIRVADSIAARNSSVHNPASQDQNHRAESRFRRRCLAGSGNNCCNTVGSNFGTVCSNFANNFRNVSRNARGCSSSCNNYAPDDARSGRELRCGGFFALRH